MHYILALSQYAYSYSCPLATHLKHSYENFALITLQNISKVKLFYNLSEIRLEIVVYA